MTTEFERDLTEACSAIDDARADLAGLAGVITDADLERARRGEWTVAGVLGHLVLSGGHSAGLMASLRGREPETSDSGDASVTSVADALGRLDAARASIRDALGGIGEDEFYELQDAGHQTYSLRSAALDVALHDRQHLAQIREILASG